MKVKRLDEQAIEKKKAEKIAESLCETIQHHFVLVFVLNSHQAFNHWIGEISGHLKKISRLEIKPNNRKLSIDFIRDHLTWHLDTINDADIFVYTALRTHNPPFNIDVDQDTVERFQHFANYLYEYLPKLLTDKEDRPIQFYADWIKEAIDKYKDEDLED